jgi:hypothetical protein
MAGEIFVTRPNGAPNPEATEKAKELRDCNTYIFAGN